MKAKHNKLSLNAIQSKEAREFRIILNCKYYYYVFGPCVKSQSRPLEHNPYRLRPQPTPAIKQKTTHGNEAVESRSVFILAVACLALRLLLVISVLMLV